jgi:hypothetical protein
MQARPWRGTFLRCLDSRGRLETKSPLALASRVAPDLNEREDSTDLPTTDPVTEVVEVEGTTPSEDRTPPRGVRHLVKSATIGCQSSSTPD